MRKSLMFEQARLYRMLDENPESALAEAQRLTSVSGINKTNVQGLRACIFIDAGACLSDVTAVSEGISILKKLDTANTPEIRYNIANGLATLASIQDQNRPGRLDTSKIRQEARSYFRDAGDHCQESSFRSRAFTNLGNQLSSSYRWAEAYDAYAAALAADPVNAVALSGITDVLRWRMKRRVEREGSLRRTAVRYLVRAHKFLEKGREYGGANIVKKIHGLMTHLNIDSQTPEPPAEPAVKSPYARFVRSHRLGLCLAPEVITEKTKRWDHLIIPSVTEPASAGPCVPLIFAMWNILKADFVTARWLAFSAMEEHIPESGSYADTLDYALYGVHPSALAIAQKAAFDILDKIAVAASFYLKLPGDPTHVYFGSRWHILKKNSRAIEVPVRWLPEVEQAIQAGNPALIALAELAYDYSCGYLTSKKEIRNSATHRLIVLHDMNLKTRNSSSAIERHQKGDFERIVIESLQVVRAALLYFHEVIAFEEAHRRGAGHDAIVEMPVPSHEWVRGN